MLDKLRSIALAAVLAAAALCSSPANAAQAGQELICGFCTPTADLGIDGTLDCGNLAGKTSATQTCATTGAQFVCKLTVTSCKSGKCTMQTPPQGGAAQCLQKTLCAFWVRWEYSSTGTVVPSFLTLNCSPTTPPFFTCTSIPATLPATGLGTFANVLPADSGACTSGANENLLVALGCGATCALKFDIYDAACPTVRSAVRLAVGCSICSGGQ